MLGDPSAQPMPMEIVEGEGGPDDDWVDMQPTETADGGIGKGGKDKGKKRVSEILLSFMPYTKYTKIRVGGFRRNGEIHTKYGPIARLDVDERV